MLMTEGSGKLFWDPMLAMLGLVEQGGGWEGMGVQAAFLQVCSAGNASPRCELMEKFAPMCYYFVLLIRHNCQQYCESHDEWGIALSIYYCYAHVLIEYTYG